MEKVIITIGIMYFVGHLLTHFFSKSKIPDVLILIVFGILIGPVCGFLTPEQIGPAGSLFTSMALIVILFEGGLGLQLQTLYKSATQAVTLTTVFFLVSVSVVSLILYFWCGFHPMSTVVAGCICAGTSSAVVIPMVTAIKTGKESTSVLIIESAITDVLCIVFAIGVLRSIETGDFAPGRIAGNLIASLVLASVIGLLGGYLWLRIINKVRNFESTQFATFFSMFIVYGVAELLDFSGPIAALAFGIVLGNNDEVGFSLGKIMGTKISVGAVSAAERMLYKEIVFLMKIFFFIYLGLSISFNNPYMFIVALAIVGSLYILRPLAVKVFITKSADPRDKTIISVMIPKGLAAAVLAMLPAQYNVPEANDIQSVTFGVILISIVFTSVLIPLLQRTALGRFYRGMF